MQNARIILRYKDNLKEFDAIDEQITLDVRFDPTSLQIDSTRPIFGAYGSPQREECYPLLLKKDGKLDYGGFAEQAERVGHINLLEKKLITGELTTFTDANGEEWTYYVHSIDLL